MERSMRRRDRETSREGAEGILKAGRVGTLSTVDKEGQPYGVPLNYVYYKDAIYFHSALEGHKLDNINFNNNVCFSVYGRDEILPDKFSTRYESVVAFGKARVVDGQEKREALVEFINVFSPGYTDKGIKYINADIDKCLVVKIEISSLSGKAANLG